MQANQVLLNVLPNTDFSILLHRYPWLFGKGIPAYLPLWREKKEKPKPYQKEQVSKHCFKQNTSWILLRKLLHQC